MQTQTLFQQLLQLALFSVFIHAIIEVLKGVSTVGLWGIIKELWGSVTKNAPLSTPTITTMVFVLALVYCRVFDFGAMIGMLGVKVEETNMFAWWLDYIGTASVVYVGVDVFYAQIKKLRASIDDVQSVPAKS